MNKKAQAAMEFLMTYGWAILVVIAAIAALAYFGVLDPSRMLPEKCEFPAGIDCIDKAAIDADADTVGIALKNNIGFGMTIDDVTSDNSTNGCSVSNYTLSPTGTISNNQQVTITVDCGSVSAGKFDETFYVTYTNAETSLQHKAVGTVRGRA
ncbi:hypothetical protein GF327_07410 [Candidatus Woesearchaeota archaeon]|nr:hypothetical protein [Candidatus Woesearchaeota archaeon]